MSSHYDTLGVSREANQNEIKKAFRDLAKKHHPDVGGCETKFKAMSNAADILSNEEKRRFYDLSLKNQHGQYNFQTPKGQPRTHAGPAPRTGFERFLETFFRPRNMLLGSVGTFIFVTTVQSYLKQDQEKAFTIKGHNDLVHAWKNPNTGQYEQPAPWDPAYKRLRPKLELVSRDQVRMRHRDE